MKKFPWQGVIPQEDIEIFESRQRPQERAPQPGSRPALIVVNMTREFVDSAYPTGWSLTGGPATAANKVLLGAARKAGIPVFFTNHLVDDMTTAEQSQRGPTPAHNRRIPLDRSLANGNVIADDIEPIEGEIVVGKLKPSGFFGTPLDALLNFHMVDTLIVTGMVTSGCVRATVTDGYTRNYRVMVPHECVADWSQFSHLVTLFELHMKFADVVDLDEAVAYLSDIDASVRK